jgi:hypothetical protein
MASRALVGEKNGRAAVPSPVVSEPSGLMVITMVVPAAGGCGAGAAAVSLSRNVPACCCCCAVADHPAASAPHSCNRTASRTRSLARWPNTSPNLAPAVSTASSRMPHRIWLEMEGGAGGGGGGCGGPLMAVYATQSEFSTTESVWVE